MMLDPGLVQELIPQSVVYIQLVRFALVFAIGMLVTRLVLVPIITRIVDRSKVDNNKKAKHQLQNFAVIIGTFVTFVAALQAGEFGNLVTIIGAIAAALTVAIGFGMREEVGNIVSGIFIHLDNPFVKGDYIQVMEQEGEVREISLRATYLNGHASEEIVVPNSKITSNSLKNFTRGVKTKSAIEFKMAPEKAEETAELAKNIADEDEEVLESPDPSILNRKYEDGKLLFELRYWVRDSADSKRIKSRVLRNFNNQAVERGLLKEEEKKEEATV